MLPKTHSDVVLFQPLAQHSFISKSTTDTKLEMMPVDSVHK